jgi:hypothetical protein
MVGGRSDHLSFRRITLLKTILSSNTHPPLYLKQILENSRRPELFEVKDPCDGEPLTSASQKNSVKKTKTLKV